MPHVKLSADGATQYRNVGLVVQAAQKAGVKDITFMPSGVVLKTPMPPGPGNPATDVALPPPPGAKPATPKPPSDIPDPIRLYVDFDGGIYYNGIFVGATAFESGRYVGPSATLDVLAQNLKADAGQKIQPEVHIEPHRLSSYAAVEKVIAEVNKAGFTKVGVLGGI